MHGRAAVLSHAARCLGGLTRLSCGLAGAILVLACGGATSEQLIGPTESRCQIVLAAVPAVPASGSTLSLTVSATRDCTWTASSDAPWVIVSPTTGQGSATVALAVEQNARPTSRSAGVAVNDSRITISQEAAPCRFELAAPAARVDGEGGRASVGISTLDGCQWQASSPADWLRVLTLSGNGSGTVDIDVSRNGGPERSATILIAGLSFVVSQDSGVHAPPPGSPPPPPGSPLPPACSFAIDSDRANVPASGGAGSVRVTTTPGCAWSASTGTSWISVQRSAGTGPGTIGYQVAPNHSTVSDRSGSISVAGHTHGVTQPACALTVEPGVPGFLASGGESSFGVTTDSGCTWSASSTADWITIVRGHSGAGTGSVIYRVEPNAIERDRSGTIVVSGRAKTIVQQALGQGG